MGMRAWLAAATVGLLGCSGEIALPSGLPAGAGQPPGAVVPTPKPAPTAAIAELRRLSRAELDNTLSALLGDPKHTALNLMPGDAVTPYDNASATQQASAVWLEAAEAVTSKVLEEALADPARRAALIPCTPTSDDDLACLEQTVRAFGRRALRRPVSSEEATTLMALHAQARQRGTFVTSVSLALRQLLLDPEFLYRIELGTPVAGAPGTFQLNAYELASRLSFLLQGRTPPDWLLELAASGGLETAEGVRTAAQQLLDAPEGRSRVEIFHAMWLGYQSLPHAADFNQALVTESTALVRKVVFEDKSDYRALFTSEETFIDDALATHYGLPATGAPGFRWVKYGSAPRKGILSHGALLSNGVKQTDSSPTLRGKWIRNRLFCQEIPKPPPDVVADVPPPATGAAVCKKDRYAVHDSVASCAGCHTAMDPIGFGLEQFDRAGKFRTQEAEHPECAIDGKGALTGVGAFVGAAGLADLLVQNGQLEGCVVKQLFRFTAGRTELPSDGPLLEALTERFVASGRRFDALVLALVSDDTFRQRREAP